jgi:hypothetical protein
MPDKCKDVDVEPGVIIMQMELKKSYQYTWKSENARPQDEFTRVNHLYTTQMMKETQAESFEELLCNDSTQYYLHHPCAAAVKVHQHSSQCSHHFTLSKVLCYHQLSSSLSCSLPSVFVALFLDFCSIM